MSIDIQALNELQKRFYSEFITRFHSIVSTEVKDKILVITISANNSDIGNLNIWVDEKEITVGLSKYFHHHFDDYVEKESIKDIKEEIIETAINFINDMLQGNLIISFTHIGNRVLTTSIRNKTDNAFYSLDLNLLMDKIDGLKNRKFVAKYTWFGPTDEISGK